MRNFFLKLAKSPNKKNVKIVNKKICLIVIFIGIFPQKPIVQKAERTAHNGLVVGSNPARLKTLKI